MKENKARNLHNDLRRFAGYGPNGKEDPFFGDKVFWDSLKYIYGKNDRELQHELTVVKKTDKYRRAKGKG